MIHAFVFCRQIASTSVRTLTLMSIFYFTRHVFIHGGNGREAENIFFESPPEPRELGNWNVIRLIGRETCIEKYSLLCGTKITFPGNLFPPSTPCIRE